MESLTSDPCLQGSSPVDPSPHLTPTSADWGRAGQGRTGPGVPRAASPSLHWPSGQSSAAVGGCRAVEWGTRCLCSCPRLGSDLERETRTEGEPSAELLRKSGWQPWLLPWWALHANEPASGLGRGPLTLHLHAPAQLEVSKETPTAPLQGSHVQRMPPVPSALSLWEPGQPPPQLPSLDRGPATLDPPCLSVDHCQPRPSFQGLPRITAGQHWACKLGIWLGCGDTSL